MEPFKYICHYWGKSSKSLTKGNDIHLLIYHRLDAAAVADYWWDQSVVLQNTFCRNEMLSKQRVKAWLLLFIALHDIGKFDIQFQYKSAESWLKLDPTTPSLNGPSTQMRRKFNHGAAGLYRFNQDSLSKQSLGDFFSFFDAAPHPCESWSPWVETVTGHHGFILYSQDRDKSRWEMPASLTSYAAQDRQAREERISILGALLLTPVGLSINDISPDCSSLLAGFCSLADWLGSWTTTNTFLFNGDAPSDISALRTYFQDRQQDASRVLELSGLVSNKRCYEGVHVLPDDGYQPRQLQVLVGALPVVPGLTVIEAPTGSGKTETTLAYTWKLIGQQATDSVIFALPAQVTASTMLTRMGASTSHLFSSPNLVLAHSNSRFNHLFQPIKSHAIIEQEQEEAWIQCCQRLSQSNKKVFLGQIGVCTIGQVLISVLSVKHHFTRGLGIGRSVLIVDEVHAYDTYMNGLLEAVFKAQADVEGSIILLSATLPMKQKQKLLGTYGLHTDPVENNSTYPLINWRGVNGTQRFDLLAHPE